MTGGVSPYTYVVSGARPPGLSLDSTGLLSGTPTTVGTYSFTVTVTDSLGVSTTPTTFSITIASSTPMLQVSPSSLTFNSIAGGDAPPPQAISVIPATGATSTAFTVVLDGGQSGTPAPSWLTVQLTKGNAPAQLIVSVDQGSMQAGRLGTNSGAGCQWAAELRIRHAECQHRYRPSSPSRPRCCVSWLAPRRPEFCSRISR